MWPWKSLCGLMAQEGGMFFDRKASVQISIYKVFKKKQNFTCEMKDNILQNSMSDLPTSTQLHKVIKPYKNDYPLRILLINHEILPQNHLQNSQNRCRTTIELE